MLLRGQFDGKTAHKEGLLATRALSSQYTKWSKCTIMYISHLRFSYVSDFPLRGLLGQTRKRFRLAGVLPLGLDGLRLDGLLRGHGSSAGPGKVQHDTQPQEAQEHQLVVE